MITRYDYAIIAFYLLFMLGLGLFFRRLSKNTSDYFRAGGAMPWWITGVSAWIAGFSAWTFTGAAGKIYQTGTLVLCLYYSSLLPIVIVLIYTSYRFRRMRVVTWMEAVRNRYGRPTEQVYTWIKLPLLLVFGGVGLNAIGVFMSATFHVPLVEMLIILGTAVTLVASVGGAFGVLASDFVQMLLVVGITILASFLALRQPRVRGVSGLIEHVPSSFFHWTELARAPVIAVWTLSLTWLKIFEANGMENSTMFLMVKNDRDARRMVLIPLIGTIIGPLIWIIPPMTARITHPHLAAEYPQMVVPAEAAFVAVCRDVMPQGLIALLICAMFGATLTSMDAALNKGVGVFVRNFYLPLINPECPEKRLLKIGKLCTLLFGAIIVLMALIVAKYRSVGLFDLMNQLAASIAFPMMFPLVYGLFYKRTPGWSGWSTVIVGFISSLAVKYWLPPEVFARLQGSTQRMNADETTYSLLFATVFIDTIVCTLWYFSTSLFYAKSDASQRESIDRFFVNLQTPIEGTTSAAADEGEQMYLMLGQLCVVYGSFVLLLTVIPNRPAGRACFVFCGGIIFVSGLILRRLGKRYRRAALETPSIREMQVA
jgi:SSS family solute:Na+ symporter